MPTPKNLVVFMAEGMPASAIAACGCAGIQTPNLDRLAARSAVFGNAYCTQPVCTPGRASLFTGQYPHAIPCPDNEHNLPADAKCFPELADFPGWRTAMIGKWDLGDEAFAQHGFGTWRSIDASRNAHYGPGRDRSGETHYERFLRTQGYAPDVPPARRGNNPHGWFSKPVAIPESLSPDAYAAREAAEFIGDSGKAPFMLWMPFLRTKPPAFDAADRIYDPADMPLPATWNTPPGTDRHLKERLVAFQRRDCTAEDWQRGIAALWAQVTLIDRYVGQVLDALETAGGTEDTIVVFTGDHGSMLGEHRISGKCLMYEESIKTPMLIHIPGVTDAGSRVGAPFGHVDLVPTLLDAMGRPVPPGLPGKSWLPFLKGEAEAPGHDVFVQWNGASGKGEFLKLRRAITEEIGPYWDGPDLVSMAEAWTEPLRTAITPEGWKYTHSPVCGEHVLVNLREDPGETQNLAHEPSCRGVLADMQERVARWQEQTGDAPPPQPRKQRSWPRFVKDAL